MTLYHDGENKVYKFLGFVLPYAVKIALKSKVNVTINPSGNVSKIVSDGVTTANNYKSSNVPVDNPNEESNALIDNGVNRNNLKIDSRFIVSVQGKQFITYNGLLAYAKQSGGIKSKEVLRLDISEDWKSAVAHVRVTMNDGSIFEDVGTCTPLNSKSVTTYPQEMAVTRGFARAIRTGLNVDYCSKEELS